MKTFKSITDLQQIRNHPLHSTVESLVVPVIAATPNYRPEDDGYLVLIEPDDVDRVLSDMDMPWRLSEVPFEAVTVVDGCFHAVYIIENHQLSGLSLLREENHVNNIMTDDELRRLVKVLKSDKNKMVGSVCLFLLATGARLNEALSARWEHFDLERRNWTIPSAHSKSRKIRSIPLNDQALSILDNLGTRGKYDHPFIGRRGKLTTINRVWDRLRNDAGLPHLRLHDLRHQYASFLINQGRTLFEVQQILGHSDPSVTMRYAHLSTKVLQDAANSASNVINAAMSESP